MAVADGVSKIVAFIATPYIAVKLQPAAFGRVGVTTSIFMFLSVIIHFGSNEFGILMVSPNHDPNNIKSTIGSILSLRLTLLTIFFPIIIVGIIVFDDLNKDLYLWASGFFLYFVLSFAIDWIYIALEKMWVSSLVRMISRIIFVILVFLFISTPDDAIISLLIQGFSEFVVLFILYFILIKKRLLNYIFFSTKEIIPLLKKGFPILLSTVGVAVFGNIDVVILKYIKSSEEVGIYSGALKLLIISFSLKTTLGPFIFPKIVNAVNISKHQSQYFLRKYQVYLTSVAIMIAFNCFLYSDQIINLIFGTMYKDSALIFSILIWVAFFDITGIFFSYFVFSIDQKIFAKRTLTVAVIYIILNLILVTLYGAVGSAIAYFISSFILITLNFLLIYRNKIQPLFFKNLFYPVVIGIVIFYLSYKFISTYSSVISSISGIIIFIILLIYLNLLNLKDIIPDSKLQQ